MAITLRSLLEFVQTEGLNILTGEDNLDRVVRWTHMVESLEISTFLEGQEVAFTTGAALKSKDELFEMVKSIIANQAAGMIINIGPYIKKIPEEIIVYCEERDFPLMTAPWETHLAHIMQIFCLKITESDKENMELSSAVKNAIFFPAQEELYFPALERYHYSPDWSYCVALIQILKGANPMEDDREIRILKYIENQLSHRYKNVIIFEHDKKIVLIFSKMTEDEVADILKSVIKNYQGMLVKGEQSYIGIGQCTKNMKCISKSYNQANGVLKLQKSRNRGECVETYSSLGLYKLLLTMDDQAIVKEYYQEMLGILLKYDETNDTDYCKVLECYLNHSGSVKEASEELFVHRNTINKKINKIEEITKFDLADLEVRVKFKIAFMIQEIL